jgi:tetratricopeptide (TPR) repeat protein
MAYLSLGDGANAQVYLQPIAGQFPNDIPLQEAFGGCLALQRKYDEALSVFQQAIGQALDGEQSARLQFHVVAALQDLSRTDEALQIVSGLKQTLPDNPEVLLAEAKLHSDLGNMPETKEGLRQVLALEPGNIDAFVLLHKMPRREPDPGTLEQISAFLGDDGIDYRDDIKLNFLAGELLDKSKSYDRAFGYFERANGLRRKTNGAFEMKSHLALVDRIKTVFDRALFANLDGVGKSAEQPIFIVGMPRSGTSLAEQILASHADIHGVGEREEITQISESLGARLGSDRPYPECVPGLTEDISRSLGREYLAGVSVDAPEGARVTDKMPRNFMDIGLIRLLFPRAPIVHCQRDPLDTCLSCYVSDFGRRQKFLTGFSDLGGYFHAYLDLMAHWDSVLDVPVYNLQYEDLVANPEIEIPKLIEHCDLPWDENCMSPHQAARPVIAASRWQVRRPIYKSSVSRSERYGDHLDGLKTALGL